MVLHMYYYCNNMSGNWCIKYNNKHSCWTVNNALTAEHTPFQNFHMLNCRPENSLWPAAIRKSTETLTDFSENQNIVIQIRLGHFLHPSTTAASFFLIIITHPIFN